MYFWLYFGECSVHIPFRTIEFPSQPSLMLPAILFLYIIQVVLLSMYRIFVDISLG